MARSAPVPYGRCMFTRGLRIASIGGIAIEVHPSWLLIFGIVSYLLAVRLFPDAYEGWSTATYWLVGAVATLLLFVTVLLHELAHAVVAIRRGLPVPRITLFAFGGVSHLSRQPRSAGEEFAIAAAGPAASLVLALVIGGAWFAVRGASEHSAAMFGYLAAVNLLLAGFNLLPGFPLDGGRVLRSIVWNRTHSFRKATRIAAGTGEVFGWALIAAGAVALFFGQWFTGIWLIMLGWFLLGAARAEANGIRMDTMLSRLRARDLMHTTFAQVTPGEPIQSVVDEHIAGKGERAVVVANDRNVLGILTVRDLRRVPRREWASTPAQRIMTPRAEVVTIAAGAPATDILPLFGERRLHQLPVIDEGRMIGLITRREFLDRVHLAEEITPDDGPDGEAEPPPVRPSGGDGPAGG